MTKPLYQALRGFLFLLLISISYTASSQTDFLFIVDNSGSISPEEFDKFTDIIEATGQTLSNTCPNSEFAIFHYGGAFGQEYTIQNDFINWSATSSVDRVYVDCISSGTTDCGDDLPVAFGSIMTELGNGLNLTPGNDLAVVIFTDADGLSFAGLNMSPCTFAACSVLLPMTNFNSFISAYPAVSSYVIGVANTDNEGLLVDYVHGAGSYNAINLNDDPNLIADSFSEVVECEKGSIGLAKDLTSLTNNNDGTFTVEFLLTVENFATMTPLSNLEIFDDIVTQFSGNNPTNFTAINGSLTASSSWNGTAGSNILTGGQGLTSGMTGTVSIKFDISHDGPSTTIENTAIANGTDPDNNVLTDDSTDGLNPDPNGDGSPTEDTPTPVLLPEIPVIGLAKNLTDLTDNNDGTYTVEFLLTAENLSTSSVLNNLIINDDVVSQFSAFNPSNFMTISGSLNGAASWNGTAGSNIVQNGQSIAAGQTETISIKFDLVHSGDAVTIFNSATIKGTGPNGVMPTDTSEDGLNPDPNGDGNPDENSPTPVLLPETPVIGLAKSLTSLTDNSDGTFTVEFLLTAENLSTSSTLNNLIFNDDIVTQFSAFTPSNFMTLSGSLNGAASWNGTAGSNIVQSGQSIAAGQTETISIKFDLVHEGDATTILNTATIEGTDPNNRTVTDTSHDGVNPDPNNDGNPSEDDPTPVLLPAVNPTIGLAKNLTDLVNNMDGTYSIEFLLTVENFSFFALTDLEIFDDIVGQFSGYMPTNYTVINGSLSGNSSWDGTANSNILSAGQSISIGATENISIKFDITPTGVMSAIFNSATAKGTSPSSEVACDTSYDGLNPDPNNDDDPGEEMPTPVVLPEFSMISGTVFKDQNANGLNNPGDSGIFSVTVQLRDCTGNVIATTSTDMNGNYAFSNLFPSNYEIYINPNSLPLNCEITAPNVGTDDTIDSDILMNGRSQCISVSTDEDIIVDAGFFPNPPVIGLAKSLTSMSSNMDGSYTVEFLFNVENFSNFALSDLQILDDVASQFVGYMPSNFSVIDGSLTGNPSWNGGATTNILAAGQSIAVGVVEDISVEFVITPSGTMTTVFNVATAIGTAPNGEEAIDDSHDGLDSDPNGDGDPNENTPTPIVLPEFSMVEGSIWKDENYDGIRDNSENGVAGIGMHLTDCSGTVIISTMTGINGEFNFSNVYPGSFQVFMDPSILPDDCEITLSNQGTDETKDSDMLSTGFSDCFDIIESENLKVDGGIFTPGFIGLAKSLVSTTENVDGTLEVEFLFTIRNYATYTVSNLNLSDNVLMQFANFSPSNLAAIDGSLMANTGWTGLGDSNILSSGQSIAAGATGTVRVMFRIVPDGITSQAMNVASISGTDPAGGDMMDDSTDGLNPDPNGDGTPDENAPTFIPLPLFAKIGNQVFEDCNGNGVRNVGDQGIEGVTVNLYNLSDGLVKSTVTDASGNYLFDEIRHGNYYLEFIPPSGYDATISAMGNSNVDSNVNGSNGVGTTSIFTLSSGECNLTYDAGFHQCVNIGERVFYDVNRNDLFDLNENGINGIIVQLWKMEGNTYSLYDQTSTSHEPGSSSSDGYFKFCAAPGIYKVKFVIPQIGFVAAVKDANGFQVLGTPAEASNDSDINTFDHTTNSFMAYCSHDVCNIGAGFYPMAQFGNRVWNDSNGDGLQNNSEQGVAGVVVKAYDSNDQMSGQTLTDVNGNYNIDYLGKDDYYLEFTPPSTYSFTSPNNGAENMDSDVTGENGQGTTTIYSLNPGDNLDDVDAGLTSPVVPVQWIGVDAFARTGHNEVNWKTASEVNNDVFELERSLGNGAQFEKIATIEAMGNSSEINSYVYNDRDVDYIGTYFYRLKQIDLNTNFSYSTIVSVRRGIENSFSVFPNPTSEFINLEFGQVKNAQLELFTVDGKLAMDLYQGSTVDLNVLQINIGELPAGTYYIKGKLDGDNLEKKIIIQ